MQETPNYKFKKPENDDFFNIEDLNANFDKIDEVIAEVSKNKIIQKSLTIPNTDWIAEVNGPYTQKLVLAVEGITVNTIVNVTIALVSEEVAQDCGLASMNESGKGTITFYAESVPSTAIQATYYVLEGGGENTKGMVLYSTKTDLEPIKEEINNSTDEIKAKLEELKKSVANGKNLIGNVVGGNQNSTFAILANNAQTIKATRDSYAGQIPTLSNQVSLLNSQVSTLNQQLTNMTNDRNNWQNIANSRVVRYRQVIAPSGSFTLTRNRNQFPALMLVRWSSSLDTHSGYNDSILVEAQSSPCSVFLYEDERKAIANDNYEYILSDTKANIYIKRNGDVYSVRVYNKNSSNIVFQYFE